MFAQNLDWFLLSEANLSEILEQGSASLFSCGRGFVTIKKPEAEALKPL